MDEVSKFRLTGAIIWLSLLIIIVPGWYSNPVNFQPEGSQGAEPIDSQPVVQRAYVLPGEVSEPVKTLPQIQPRVDSAIVKQSAPAKADVSDSKPDLKSAKVASDSSTESPQWLLKVAAYKKLSNANKVLGMLDREYDVWIKEFPASKTFSVRTGPYTSKAAAQRDKLKIDRALHTQSQIVQVK